MDPHCDEFARLFAKVNWTQCRVADELGVHPSVVTRYLKGATHPSITVLRLFAAIIGDVVMLPGEQALAVHSKHGPRWLQEWQEEALEALQRIDPKSRKAFIAALRSMLDALARSTQETRHPPPAHEADGGAVDQALKRIVREQADQVLAEAQEARQPTGRRKRHPQDV